MESNEFDQIWLKVKKVTNWKHQNELADFLNIQAGSISNAKARGIFRESWLEQIAKEFNSSIKELTGELEPLQPTTTVNESASGRTMIPHWDNPDPELFHYVPMAEAQLSAGGGSFILSEDFVGYYAYRKDWLKRIATAPGNVILMMVQGNSMSPTIKDKDTVMIDTGRTKVVEGQIYALRLDETIMIKRLTQRPGDIINVISDNKEEYETYQAKRSELHIIGQIIFFCRDLVAY